MEDEEKKVERERLSERILFKRLKKKKGTKGLKNKEECDFFFLPLSHPLFDSSSFVTRERERKKERKKEEREEKRVKERERSGEKRNGHN